MRYAKKTDLTHAAIRDGLRSIFGAEAVQDVSMCAGLGFDLIVVSRGILRFLEIKGPKSVNRLTDSERAALERYGEFYHVVTSLDEALAAISDGTTPAKMSPEALNLAQERF